MRVIHLLSFLWVIGTWVYSADYGSVLSVADSRYAILKDELSKNENDSSRCISHFEKYFASEAEVIRQFPEMAESSKTRLKKTIQYLIQSTDIFYSKYKENDDPQYFSKSAQLAEFLCRLKSNLVDENKYRSIVDEFKFKKTSSSKQSLFESIISCYASSPQYSETSLKYLVQIIEFRKKNMDFMNSEHETKVRDLCVKIKSDYEGQIRQIFEAFMSGKTFSCKGLDYLYKSAISTRDTLKEFKIEQNFEEIREGVVKLAVEITNGLNEKISGYLKEISGNPITPNLTESNAVQEKVNYFITCYQSMSDARMVFDSVFEKISQDNLSLLQNKIKTVVIWNRIADLFSKNKSIEAFSALSELRKSEFFQPLGLDTPLGILSSSISESFFKEADNTIKSLVEKDSYEKAIEYMTSIEKLDFPWIKSEIPRFKQYIYEAGYLYCFNQAKKTEDFIFSASWLVEAKKFKNTPDIKAYFGERATSADFHKIQKYEDLSKVTMLLIDDFTGWDSSQGTLLLYKPPINSKGVEGTTVFFRIFIKRKMDDYYIIGTDSSDLGLLKISDDILVNNKLNFGDFVSVLAVYVGNAETTTFFGSNRTIPMFSALSVVK